MDCLPSRNTDELAVTDPGNLKGGGELAAHRICGWQNFSCYWKALGAGLASVALFFALLVHVLPTSTFLYDEADYAFAASKGVIANALDSPSLSLLDFLALGLANRKAEKNTQTRGKAGETLAEYVRGIGDITLYRHYHPPLYFYTLSVAGRLCGFNERGLRLVSVSAVVLTAFLVGYFAFCLMRETGVHFGVAVTTGGVAFLFTASAPILIETGMLVTPHSLFAVFAAATVGCVGMFLVTGRRFWWRATALSLGLGFLTLEYALVLAASVIFALALAQQGKRSEDGGQYGHLMLEAFAIVLIVIFVLWPGGLVKLTIIKNYLFFLYFALMRAESAYGSASLTEIWRMRIVESPQLLFAVGALLLLAWRMRRNAKLVGVLPAISYIGFLFCANLRNHSPHPTYVSSLVPALGIGLGMTVGMLVCRNRWLGVSLATVLGCFMLTATALLAWPPDTRDHGATIDNQEEVITAFRDKRISLPDGRCLSVPSVLLPSIHYYAPSLLLRPYDAREPHANSFGRCDYALVTVAGNDNIRYPEGRIVADLGTGDAARHAIVRR